MVPIHHYYHIYAAGAWQEPVREHIRALTESGLSRRESFSLHVGIVGREEDANAVRRLLDDAVKWAEIGRSEEGWEQLTLGALARDSHSNDGLAVYAHTKGAHTPNRFNTDWRRRMTYFTITKWRDAVAALETHAAYGCHWMQLEGNWLFGGNFWWTHMSHLRLFPPPKLDTRWQAEEWIGQLPQYVPEFRVCDPAPPFPGRVCAAKG
jgi:hypothetical protein